MNICWGLTNNCNLKCFYCSKHNKKDYYSYMCCEENKENLYIDSAGSVYACQT